jgi:serine/threonine-protein kinase haspin
LHENNICVKFGRPTNTSTQDILKYGRSGIEVTILDYGLSRAEAGEGDIVYKDLETDLGVFHGTAIPQYDTYRRMRTHLFTGDRTMYPKRWHTEESKAMNNGHCWDEFTPYTNVLW